MPNIARSASYLGGLSRKLLQNPSLSATRNRKKIAAFNAIADHNCRLHRITLRALFLSLHFSLFNAVQAHLCQHECRKREERRGTERAETCVERHGGAYSNGHLKWTTTRMNDVFVEQRARYRELNRAPSWLDRPPPLWGTRVCR